MGMGWRSINPVEAVAAVHEIEGRNQLLQVVYEARHPEARRMALLKLNDPGLFAAFAQSDPSPIVRRRVVRELTDTELIQRILDTDDDVSVRQSAENRLKQLAERG